MSSKKSSNGKHMPVGESASLGSQPTLRRQYFHLVRVRFDDNPDALPITFPRSLLSSAGNGLMELASLLEIKLVSQTSAEEWADAILAGIKRTMKDRDPSKTVSHIAFCVAGLVLKLMDDAVNYAKRRRIGGKPIVAYQMTSAKIADMAVSRRIIALRVELLLLQGGHSESSSEPPDLCLLPLSSNQDNIIEICRSATCILSTSLELMAGAAFVEMRELPPLRAVLMLLVVALVRKIEVNSR